MNQKRAVARGAAVALDDVLVTDALVRRPARPPDPAAENAALLALARQLASAPERMLDALVAAALDLCRAGTAGVSLLGCDESGDAVFRWDALAGALASYVGGTTPRGFSPCGVTLDRGTPQLFDRPGRYFTYFAAVSPPIVEGLVVPLGPPEAPLGTIWIVSHREERRFDWEDARVMSSLAHFSAAALRLTGTAAENARLLAAEQTARREAERLAGENAALAERFRGLLRVFPNGSVNIFDRDLRYVMAEGAGLERIGRSPDQLVGKTLGELFPPEQVALVAPYYRRAFAGETVAFDLPLGEAGTWGIVAAPLRDGDGAVRRVMAVTQDVTDRVRAHEAERRARAELEAAAALRDGVLATVTHDLKNPLTAVRGQAQLLGRRAATATPEKVAAAAAEIEETARRMTDMLDELLDLVRARSGTPRRLDLAPVDLAALARGAIQTHAAAADRHVLRLEAAAEPIVGRWDARGLTRVLDNLLSNAVKYSPPGSEVMVRVGAEERDGARWAVLTVEDRGIGIATAELPHVFEPFWRGAGAAERVPGTGVGLASVRHVVELHGGDVSVRSAVGAGSVFTVRLPLRTDPPP